MSRPASRRDAGEPTSAYSRPSAKKRYRSMSGSAGDPGRWPAHAEGLVATGDRYGP
jgi:hypothetical protein